MKNYWRCLFVFLLLPFFLSSCKPINIFSPLVNPSRMNNDAKMDAAYNAISDGNYASAIDYFSDVIGSSSGEQLTEAYLGRASAYLNTASSTLGDVVDDLVEGDVDFDSTGEVIESIVADGDYETFFSNVQSSADDYNAAISNSGSDIDQGILIEAYEANMMAATGVGSTAIAAGYNGAGWGPADVTVNEEYEAINDSASTHPFNISTWEDTTPANNGLRQYVDGTDRETSMLGYLGNAFDALTALEADPPLDMDITGLKENINVWVTNGLNESPLS